MKSKPNHIIMPNFVSEEDFDFDLQSYSHQVECNLKNESHIYSRKKKAGMILQVKDNINMLIILFISMY